MKKGFLFLLIVSPFLFVFSCTHEPVIPDTPVTFSHDVYPIILSGCVHSGCHDTIGGPDAAPMIDYASTVSIDRIIPGDPKASKLYQNIISTGDDRMPKVPYAPLSDRQIRLIYIWIAQGAKDN
jgi:hypothetical protein